MGLQVKANSEPSKEALLTHQVTPMFHIKKAK